MALGAPVQLLFEDTSSALINLWAQRKETQSDVTQVSHHTEYFYSGSANLTSGVSQQTWVKEKKTEDRSLQV